MHTKWAFSFDLYRLRLYAKLETMKAKSICKKHLKYSNYNKFWNSIEAIHTKHIFNLKNVRRGQWNDKKRAKSQDIF